jgi:ketosteroid isomerase-like protein
MSEENVELTRRAILEWNERGVDALLEVLDPEVEWHPPRESMEPGTYRGHDGVRDYLGRLRQVFEVQRVESVDVISVGDDVVLAVVRIAGTSAKFGRSTASGPGWSPCATAAASMWRCSSTSTRPFAPPSCASSRPAPPQPGCRANHASFGRGRESVTSRLRCAWASSNAQALARRLHDVRTPIGSEGATVRQSVGG